MQLELTSLEQKLVADMLESALADMHSEVRRTQTSSYREDLKTREHCLRDLLKKLDASGARTAGFPSDNR